MSWNSVVWGLKRTLGVGWGGELLFFEKGLKAGEKGLRGSLVSFLGILWPGPLEEILRKL